MDISVIIPTRNAEKYIKNLIEKLRTQNKKINEVIIIDTASTDKTKEICKKYDFVKFIQIKNGEFDHGGTRNRAAKEATGDILIFMTQDAYPEDNTFIDCLTKDLGKNDISAAYGRQKPRENAKDLEKFARTFNYGDKDIIKSKDDIDQLGVKTFFLSNVCSAFVKKDFWHVGGFPEKTIMNEDMIISSKLIFSDKKVLYASKASVIHSHQYTYMQQFKRNFDVGVVFTDSNKYFYNVKSESEGIKYVKQAAHYLVKNKKGYMIPHLIIDSGFRFIGYKMGKNYKKMPLALVKKMSMHSFYFNNN
ncbi:glycosyltransferase family 2 protein [Paraclostridium bifermentans]|uniref:glycosyltransferase family 2 protein n=1 Tax=Paraclostridium bifermentans TaxID=1490 RepID=UPI00290CC014|nr:glycosyltransferase [Paraclostridium bifermentans]MDU3338231.1 glycosyltransferase [Paraclostridium bifermentans]